MRMRHVAMLTALALDACGGSTAGEGDGGADGSTSDASHGNDADVDAGCPSGTPPIPDAAVYACDAAAPTERGCRAAGQDPNNPNRYPIGCIVHLPQLQGGCGGACCGPQECTCQDVPFDSGPQFECPL